METAHAAEKNLLPAEARAVVDDYFLGTYHADRARLERAFHPEAHIVGYLGTIYSDEPAPKFIDRVTGAASQKDKGEALEKRILDAHVTDNTGMVIAEVHVAGKRFIDYITIMKIDGLWTIRNKSFTTPVWP